MILGIALLSFFVILLNYLRGAAEEEGGLLWQFWMFMDKDLVTTLIWHLMKVVNDGMFAERGLHGETGSREKELQAKVSFYYNLLMRTILQGHSPMT